MTRQERFQRIDDLFQRAVDLAPSERAAFLGAACADDASLVDEVTALLDADASAAERVRGAVGQSAEQLVSELQPSQAGRRIGAYRILRELGKGGMGAVYLAARDDDEYHTEVAIKLLHHGLETAEAVARFRDERQILASLDHPGIVRLLDGGSTDDGMPFLVMEPVVGQPITAWAESRALSVTARLELFRAVCAAVGYAHQKLVVHRDLKPSNILVTAAGAPKLLDFGIARLLGPEREGRARTTTGARALTLEYASPEQVRGLEVSTATDVYSLGVVLYVLLSGVHPYAAGDDLLDLARAILERDPPRPSAVAPASRRRGLTGDVDNIVAKALQKDPRARYASVEQLADDVARHLDGRPVLARAASWQYRAYKLVRRNWVLLGAVTLLLGALTAATVVSLGEAREAERRFEDVRRLAHTLIFEVDDQIKDLAGATAARELIVGRSLGYLDSLAADAGDNVSIARELAAGYMKIGDVQGNGFSANLGRPADALQSYAKADAILDRIAADSDEDLVWLRASAARGRGEIELHRGHVLLARTEIARALGLIEALPRGAGFDYERWLRAYGAVLVAVVAVGEPALIEDAAGRVEAAAAEWERHALDPAARYWRGIAEQARARAAAFSGRADEALLAADAARATFTRLVSEYPGNGAYLREVAVSECNRGMYRSGQGDMLIWIPHIEDRPTAEEAFRRAVDVAERLAEDVHDRRASTELMAFLSFLAASVADRSPAEAVAIFDRIRTSAAAAERSGFYYSVQPFWFVDCALAEALARVGRPDDARQAIARGLTLAETLSRVDGWTLEGSMRVAMCRFMTAKAQAVLGDAAAQRTDLDAAAARLTAVIAAEPRAILPYLGLVETLEAEAALQPVERCAFLARARSVWQGQTTGTTALASAVAGRLERAHADCGD